MNYLQVQGAVNRSLIEDRNQPQGTHPRGTFGLVLRSGMYTLVASIWLYGPGGGTSYRIRRNLD